MILKRSIKKVLKYYQKKYDHYFKCNKQKQISYLLQLFLLQKMYFVNGLNVSYLSAIILICLQLLALCNYNLIVWRHEANNIFATLYFKIISPINHYMQFYINLVTNSNVKSFFWLLAWIALKNLICFIIFQPFIGIRRVTVSNLL